MAQLIAEMATQHIGEVVCGELIRRGLDPVRLNVLPGGCDAVITVSLMGSWCKAVRLDRSNLTPEAVEYALETWKAKVRRDLSENKPSEVIQSAIRQFGSEAVERVLAPQIGIA